MQKWCKTGMNSQGGRLGSFIRWLEEYSWSSVSYVDLCSRQRRENKEISFVLSKVQESIQRRELAKKHREMKKVDRSIGRLGMQQKEKW